MKPEIIFQYSPWYLLLCLFIGLVYAFLLYNKSNLNKINRNILFGLRSILVSLLAFLLLSPLLKFVSKIYDKPITVLLIDDSKSMQFNGQNTLKEALNKIKSIKKDLETKGFKVYLRTLNSDQNLENLENLKFEGKKSNFQAAIKNIKLNFEGESLSDIILISDGINNDGFTNLGSNLPIHTLGLGDTTLKKDIALKGITHNKIAYLGSKFSVLVDIEAFGYKNNPSFVQIRNARNEIISKKDFVIENDPYYTSLSFELDAKDLGKNRFIIETTYKTGEFSKLNNTREFIVDVVDGREKILIIAEAPHPDIKSLKAILDKNELFETKVLIAPSEIPKEPHDILILHNLPAISNTSSNVLTVLLTQKKPIFYFVGTKTNHALFNGSQQTLSFQTSAGKNDKIMLSLNTQFQKFNFSSSLGKFLDRFPPFIVPFGETKVNTGSEVIFYQKVGSVLTTKPALAININVSPKQAVFVGEGIWQARLEEYAIQENQFEIDDVLLKSLQLISSKDDKSKLRVYPVQETFETDESARLAIETYNDIYEQIFDQNISINITGPNNFSKSYSVKNAKETSVFNMAKLGPGIYNYKASSNILGKKEESQGQFVISNFDQELSNPKADFNLLKTLSAETNGVFNVFSKADDLTKKISENKTQSFVKENEEIKDIISLPFIFIILLSLLALEWVFRKYLGQY